VVIYEAFVECGLEVPKLGTHESLAAVADLKFAKFAGTLHRVYNSFVLAQRGIPLAA
jgi:hypothetical protein